MLLLLGHGGLLEVNLFLTLKIFIYIFESQSYKKSEGQRDLPFAGSQWLQWLGLDQAKAITQGLYPDLPHGCRVPNRWVISHCPPQTVSRELIQKWNRQNENCCLHGMPAWQVAP